MLRWISILGGLLTMMGHHARSEALFYYFRLEDQVPENHRLRLIDKHVSVEFVREQLKDRYSETGRPSIDPELLLRILLIGYLYGITSERKLVEELRMHLAWRWFTGLSFDQEIPHHSTFSKNRHGRFQESKLFEQLFERIVRHKPRLSMISGFFLRITVAVLLATPLCPATDAHSVGCPTRRAPGAVIPFELIGDHIYVSAKVNGSGPYRFIVDTGGVNLVDSSLVKPLSLQITGQETGHGVGAETVESGKTTIDRLDLGNHTFTSEKFYTFDLDQLYPGGGVKMMGMVGAPLFARYATCIDFSRHEIELINPADLDRQPAGTVLPMSTKESVITIHASFDGVPGVFQVDTGSPTTLTLNTPFVTKHDLLSRFPRHVESSSGGVGGSVREYTVRGKNLVLGSLSIVNPITALAVASKGNSARADLAGIIGNG